MKTLSSRLATRTSPPGVLESQTGRRFNRIHVVRIPNSNKLLPATRACGRLSIQTSLLEAQEERCGQCS